MAPRLWFYYFRTGIARLPDSPRFIAAIYLVALSMAEALVSRALPQVGMILHGLILVALLLGASFARQRALQRFLYALALAPLIRLTSLSLPLGSFPLAFWYLAVGAPLSLAVYVAARLSCMNRGMLGLAFGKPFWQLFIGITGIGIGYIEYLILRPQPLVVAFRFERVWLLALVLLVFTGGLEELIFRGLMQYASIRILGRFGVGYVAVVFAVFQLGDNSLPALFFAFAAGLYFGLVVLRSGSILGVTLAHGLANISLFLVFPFLLADPSPKMPLQTVFTLTAAAPAGSVVLIGILFLLALLVQKELASASQDIRLQRYAQALNIGIIPLLFAFALVAVIRVSQVLH